MSSADDRAWRVFYTRARAEKKCEHRLAERRIDVLVPKKREARQWSDRTKEVEVPLFRNYLFARVDETDRLRVLRTSGVVRCVHFHGEPARVRGETIEQLKKTQRAPDRLSVVDLRPQRGERVTITDGPESLRGLTGEVQEHRGQTAVLVRVDAIRQAVKVEVPGDWVTAGDEGPRSADGGRRSVVC
jgi:transcription antitermination factor NusG